MVKITDVAKLAGVSPSTVSHVLSGNRPISQVKKEKVLSVIKQLGYVPNPNAQAMKSARTGIIGLYAGNITDLFVTEIIRGVESVIIPQNCHLLLVSGAEFHNNTSRALDFLMSRRVDGIIMASGVSLNLPDTDFPKPNIPLISINRKISSAMPCIMPDDFHAGSETAKHFKELNVCSAAIIGGPRKRQASQYRIKGFVHAASELKLHIPKENIRHTFFSFSGGREAMASLLENKRKFDGLFCASDHIACGAMSMAQSRGIPVPECLKIIGFDNREFSEFWPVPLSTHHQPMFEMGQKGAQYLCDFLTSGKAIPKITRIPGKLILRGSSISA